MYNTISESWIGIAAIVSSITATVAAILSGIKFMYIRLDSFNVYIKEVCHEHFIPDKQGKINLNLVFISIFVFFLLLGVRDTTESEFKN